MRSRGTNIFKLIADAAMASSFGRIRWQSNMWARIGGRWDKKRIHAAGKEWITEDGTAVLVNRPCTSSCPSPPVEGVFHESKKGGWYVPRLVCQTCQHHRVRRPGVPFPQCALLSTRTPALDAAKQYADTIIEAQDKAEEILKGA